jgi:prepilin-type N-terminal cleavage/methylation domain-containing protein
MTLSSPSNRKRSERSAFSLIELLAVILILGILATVSFTALGPIAKANSLSKAGADLAGILELARTHAMARNTSVQIRLISNAPDLSVEVLTARPGEALSPLQRPRKFGDIEIFSREVPAGDAIAPTPFESIPNATIVFNSRGELLDTGGRPVQLLEIALRPSPQNDSGETPNSLAIRIAGLGGNIRVLRP